MRIPIIKGIIKRRILVNFRIIPDIIQKLLPKPFTPKLQDSYAVAGICLIKMEHIRPKRIPAFFGASSENAAHRIAVVWKDENGTPREGVFIPRRDTDSLINTLAGGRLFPGEHHRASFDVLENNEEISLKVSSLDQLIKIEVTGKISNQMPLGSVFSSLEEASRYFQGGSVGYSVTAEQNRLDGLVLHTEQWKVHPLEISAVYSSYFSDTTKFPPGTVEFDCALIMKNVLHEWHGADNMYIDDRK
jgi:hypothetical protein